MKFCESKSVLLLFISLLYVGCSTTQGSTDSSEEMPEDSEGEIVASEAAEEGARQDFVASEELKVETFQKVELVMEDLNRLISSRNYEQWLTYLTEDYVGFYGSREELKRASHADRLKNSGIVLESLGDYFIHVVVPSRANVRLDDLVFKAKDRVQAIMIIGDQRYSVYRLRLIGNEWKIDS